jgi:hypothetical protein
MRRFHPSALHLVLLGFVVVVVVGAMLSASNLANAGGVVLPPPGPPSNPGPQSYTGLLGIPSIQLRADLATSPGARFTEAEVRQYFASHRPPGAVAGSPAPTIVSIQFMSAQEVSQQLQGEGMGVPDTTLLYLVRLSGTFQGTNYGPYFGPQAPPVPTRNYAEMVFDAHTGNLIVSSAG